MSLFPITPPAPINGTGAIRGPGRRSFGLGTPAVALGAAIGQLQPDADIHFVSAGAWSLHDLIRYTIDQTGAPADVTAFTWSITPSAVNAILDLKVRGQIGAFALVMDAAQKKVSRGAFETIRGHCDRVRLAQIHAKGFTLAAGDWRVVCVTSQNMTTNPRYEAGVVSTSPAVYEFHRAWLDPLLAGGDPLNVEAVARTVEAEGGD